MRLKKIKIGAFETPNNVFLAPLAGYSNCAFRKMCTKLGAGLTFTEMVSAKGLCYGSENTRELLQLKPAYEGIKAVQLFGSDPQFISRAAEDESLAPFDIIDINMGCPVPKIFNNGEGSALMQNIPLAQSIVRAVSATGKTVTVKFRTGINEKSLITRDFAVAMEDAGASMISVHGRTRDKIYSGEVNFTQIAAAKAAVKIPVIANGGVFTIKDANKLMDETGADGVMLARGAIYNPFLFAEICGTPYSDKRSVILSQIEDTFSHFDERFATVYMRKMLAFYINGTPNSSAIRVRLMGCTSKKDILTLFNSICI